MWLLLRPPEARSQDRLREYLRYQQGTQADCQLLDGRRLALEEQSYSEEVLTQQGLFENIRNALITVARQYTEVAGRTVITSGPTALGNCIAGKAVWSVRELKQGSRVMEIFEKYPEAQLPTEAALLRPLGRNKSPWCRFKSQCIPGQVCLSILQNVTATLGLPAVSLEKLSQESENSIDFLLPDGAD